MGIPWASPWRFRLELVLIGVLTFTAFVSLSAFPLPVVYPVSSENRHDRLGAVASENKLCTGIGIDLIKVGGNAADAVRSALRVSWKYS